MGWNQVNQVIKHPMWRNIPQDARFYFVHSYYVQPKTPEPVAASTSYGFAFACALTQGNVFAVQFHPEKSQHVGLTLYQNFLNWDGAD
jgi:glutamine amidotransferase